MRENLFVFVGLLVAGFLWLGGAALPGHMPADYTTMRDTYHLAVICERWGHWLGEGHLAVWMPEFAGGHPVHALWMYGLLHPVSVIWALLPIELAYTWGALLHLAFGGTGIHAYLRWRGVRWEAALCGAIIFALSEYMLVKVGTGGVNQIWALAWVPWVLRATDRAATGERGAVPALGLWAGFGLLAGHVQVWMFMGPALALYSVAIVVREKDGMVRFKRVVLGALLALGVATVQWLPAAELTMAAGDRPDVDPDLLRQWSASGTVLAAKLLPGVFGTRPGGYWGGEQFDHEHAGLAGLAVFLLVLLGLRKNDPRRTYFACIAAAGLLLAVGYRNDITGWMNSLPIIGWSRVPGRAQSLTVLGGALLAGHGAADLLDGRLPLRALAWRGGVALFAALACGAVVVASAGPDVELGRALWDAGMVALPGGVIVAGALQLGRRKQRFAMAVPAAVLIAVVAAAPRVAAVSTEFLHVDWVARMPQGATAHRVHLADFRLPYVERQGVRTYRRPAHVEPASTRELHEHVSPGVAAWMDVGVTLVRPELERGPPAELAAIVQMVASPLPPRGPARLFHSAERGIDDRAALVRLEAGEDVLLLANDGPSPRSPPGPPGVVRMSALDSPLQVAFDTETPGGRWMFVSEKWYPGWEATVDGATTQVHRANVAFRAVYVPEGRHRVVFRYRPWILLAGAILSLGAVVLALLTQLRSRRLRLKDS